MASFVRNSIWARVCPGDLVYDIEFESLLLTHIAFSGKLLSASSSVTIHFVADSGEKRIWDVGTLLAHEREHIEVYFPFFSNKVYSVHVQGPSDICLAGVNLNVTSSDIIRHCERCGGSCDPHPVPTSSIVVPASRRVVRCLWFSVACREPRIVDVETQRPTSETHNVDCLATEDWVRPQKWYGVVHDATENRIVVAVDAVASKACAHKTMYTCIFRRPHERNGALNTAVMQYLPPSEAWYDNMLVVAQKEEGGLLDMNHDMQVEFLLAFTRAMSKITINSSFPVEAPVTPCVHVRIPSVTSATDHKGDSRLPIELWEKVLAEAPMATWMAAIKGKGLLRRAVHQLLHRQVVSGLSKFWPTEALPRLFQALSDAKGLIFGDVPFNILFGQALTVDRLDIAVPLASFREVHALILLFGYDLETRIEGETVARKDGSSNIKTYG
ncbi:hypothetical protein PTI98_008762 [Pleurotus ostreatus]|nr:hypothetical protein PTI98_008762 [Pleurotus ostreatus]